jgi:SAM-dependent methyltransferase
MNDQQILSLIREVRQKLPSALHTDVPELLDKDVLHVRLAYVPGGHVLDLGGGYSPVSAVLAKLGMKVTVADTFSSTGFYQQFSAEELCGVLQSYGVELSKVDLRDYDPLAVFGADSLDSLVCFGTIYFFNPRELLARSFPALKPRANVVLELNNAVSLLRRIRVLTGRNNTNTFHEYFHDDVHKRFWTEGDAHALARHLQLADYNLLGRNWSLYHSRRNLPRPALSLADRALRPLPSLCNDIYLVGKK